MLTTNIQYSSGISKAKVLSLPSTLPFISYQSLSPIILSSGIAFRSIPQQLCCHWQTLILCYQSCSNSLQPFFSPYCHLYLKIANVIMSFKSVSPPNNEVETQGLSCLVWVQPSLWASSCPYPHRQLFASEVDLHSWCLRPSSARMSPSLPTQPSSPFKGKFSFKIHFKCHHFNEVFKTARGWIISSSGLYFKSRHSIYSMTVNAASSMC